MHGADALLAACDDLRGRVPEPLPEGVLVERDGPLVRTLGREHGFVDYHDLGGLDGARLDALILRQVRYFSERGVPFEWKLYGHDRPADLPARLRAAGFVPDAQETVAVAPIAAIAGAPELPAGVTLREVTEEADFERIAALEERIWSDGHTWLAPTLTALRAADPESLTVYVAEAGAETICAGWVRFPRGTPFATLHGGATSPAWRGRGIYRAVVVTRANLAAGRGLRYLQVDASDASRPILEQLGFTAVTTTTPFWWKPPA